jgi:hypothetical protein
LDTFRLLFMNSNSMQEGRQHEYYWSPLLTSGVKLCRESQEDGYVFCSIIATYVWPDIFIESISRDRASGIRTGVEKTV